MARLGVDAINGLYSELPVGLLLANGQRVQIASQTELVTCPAAASVPTVFQLPAGAILLGCPVRVTVLIPAPTAHFHLTLTTAGTEVGTAAGILAAAGTVDRGNLNCPALLAAANTLTLTFDAQPGDATGRVRVTAFYILLTVPTT